MATRKITFKKLKDYQKILKEQEYPLHHCIEHVINIEPIINICDATVQNNNGQTPLQSSSESLKLLLDTTEGIALLNIKDNSGNIPLHYAAGYRLGSLKLILDVTSNTDLLTMINVQNINGANVLHYTTQRHSSALKLLIDGLSSADLITLLNVKDIRGDTPLYSTRRSCASST